MTPLPFATDSKADIKCACIAKHPNRGVVSRVATRLVVSPGPRLGAQPIPHARSHQPLRITTAASTLPGPAPRPDHRSKPRGQLNRGRFEPFAGGVHWLLGGFLHGEARAQSLLPPARVTSADSRVLIAWVTDLEL